MRCLKKNKLTVNVIRWFGNIRLGYKLAVVYALAGFLPVVTVLSVTYVQMKQILWQSENDSMESYLYQAMTSMENKLTVYNNLNNYICYNQTISQVLGYDYDSVYDMYDQLVTILDPMLASLKYFHDDVERVTIYVEKDFVRHGDTIAPISEVINEEWCREVSDINEQQWFVDKENDIVFLASPMSMLMRDGIFGILYISVEYESIFEAFEQTLQNNYGIVVFDEEDNPIYEKAFFTSEYEKYALDISRLKEELDKEKSAYGIIAKNTKANGWTAYLYKPNELIVSSVTPITRIAVTAVCVMAIMAAAAMMLLASFVTKRILRLKAAMEDVEKGNLQAMIESDSKDEIGDLFNGFDSMLLRLNTLIQEVYEGRIKEKEYEMRALQAQINPHFLYNTLSLINWKAIEAGADDISKITLALSTFYRTSLNKGKNVMSIEDEIRNTRSYMDIQLMMHDYDFDAVFDIDNTILQYQTPNLILQPLIENAIAHGIDVKTDGRGKIVVSGKDDGDEILLKVEDNGAGMTDEQAENILTKESKGYGVRNVNERIKLYYGEKYHLIIKSRLSEGTCVSLRIPKILEEKKNST